MKQLLFFVATLSVLFHSCDEADVLAEFNTTDFWEAHHSQQWDSTATANELIGTWVWEYNVCCPLGQVFQGVDKTSEDVKVKFNPDNIELFVDGEITTTTNWSVEKVAGDLFGVIMDNPIPLLHGRILFADDKVLFNAAYLDGADNYFYREFNSD